ncbi:hypothetical protein EIP86_010660 [Pleurotus ostreatoroseus]|nr:hypothetical protein EIP86_010660 [Pleurotus ostreatoroseus]
MNQSQFESILGRMRRNPRSVLDAARRGSVPEITVLTNAWTDVPGLISPTDALDVFFFHLASDKVPATPEELFSDPPNLAFASLLGLSKINRFFPDQPKLIPRIAAKWPDIFKWSLYLFSTRIQGLDKSDRRRRAALDVLAAAWYSICNADEIQAAMVRTPTTVEIATRLWLEEDAGPLPSKMSVPVGTCVLGNLLKYAEFDTLQRVLKVTGSKSDEVAKLAISRLCSTLQAPKLNATHLVIHMDFINSLSRSYKHAFRNALLSANVIWNITKALVKISTVVNTTQDLAFLDAMVSGFGYLYNCLESSDGFTWVTQAIRAGLLTAFTDCSPQFSQLDPEDFGMVKDIVERILPRYLVYRSILEAIDTSMKKIDHGPSKGRVDRSIVKDVWNKFHGLALERNMVLWRANVMKGKNVTCDNVKCMKIATTQEMRQCSACFSTFYCSKECQTVAWKEGGHRNMCKMKQMERLEGRPESISKRDAAFFHSLSIRDARRNLPRLRFLGKEKFPDTPFHDLVICIDYTEGPANVSVKRLEGYTIGDTTASTNLQARNDALIEKVQQNSEKYTLVESRIACGQSMQCVLTQVTGAFWTSDNTLIGGGSVTKDFEDKYGEDAGTAVDEVDEMMVKMILNNFMKANGEDPAF